jgi:DNA-binding MarR family transcriptional regulator
MWQSISVGKDVHMGRPRTAELVNDFLGSTQAFASAVDDVVQEDLLRAIAPKKLTFSQFKLLKLAAMAGAQTLGDLTAFLGVSNPAASKVVDKLVQRRLLVRSELGVQDGPRIRLLPPPASGRRPCLPDRGGMVGFPAGVFCWSGCPR